MIFKIFIILFLCVLIPFTMGLFFINKNMKIREKVLVSFFSGLMLQLSITQFIAFPLIILKCSFTTVEIIWVILIVILCIYSIYYNFGKIIILKNEIKIKIKMDLKRILNVPLLIAIILICFQMFYPTNYMHVDDDDSTYVVNVTTTIQTNTMFVYDPYTGEKYSEFPERYGYYSHPIYYAIVSNLSSIHPAILMHTVLPSIYILMVYFLYYLMGIYLFKNNNIKIGWFILFFSILNIFGNYSVYTSSSFLLFRIWQGKALVANLIIPLIFVIYYILTLNKYNLKYWIMLLLTTISGCMLSGMGVSLPIILVTSLGIVSAIKERKIKILLFSLLCCTPSIIIGIIYVI